MMMGLREEANEEMKKATIASRRLSKISEDDAMIASSSDIFDRLAIVAHVISDDGDLSKISIIMMETVRSMCDDRTSCV